MATPSPTLKTEIALLKTEIALGDLIHEDLSRALKGFKIKVDGVFYNIDITEAK